MHLTDDELVARLNRLADTASNNYGGASTIRAGVERIAALRAENERLTAERDAWQKRAEAAEAKLQPNQMGDYTADDRFFDEEYR